MIKVTLRQRLTSEELLGRMNATFRFLLTGALSTASILAGLLGQLAGIRTVLWVAAGVLAVSWLTIFLSPYRSMRHLPEHPLVQRVRGQ